MVMEALAALDESAYVRSLGLTAISARIKEDLESVLEKCRRKEGKRAARSGRGSDSRRWGGARVSPFNRTGTIGNYARGMGVCTELQQPGPPWHGMSPRRNLPVRSGCER